MYMLPFGETVLAWRLARGMSQDALARAAKVSRPNLSAIERGDREVTLRTLRQLALALAIRPGVLVDGVPPERHDAPLDRAALERIASAARGGGARPPIAGEARLAALLADAASVRIGAHATRKPRRRASVRRPRQADRAYFLLKTMTSPAILASLIERLAIPGRG